MQIFRTFFLLITAWLVLSGTSKAQFNSPLERNICLSIEQDMNASGEVFFSSWRPCLQEHIAQAKSTALAWNPPQCEGQSWWRRKLFKENLLIRKDSTYLIFLDPVFDFEVGKESGTNRKLYVNTRGIKVGGRLGSRFAFESDLYENQAQVPAHVDDFTDRRKVMPGEGRARRFKDTGWDYANISGYISLTPVRSQNIQFGHGKNFVGDGYRSLLLSDNAFAYPYIRYTCTVGRLQYVRTVASLMNILATKGDIEEFPKKTAAFNYLTLNIGRRLQVSLFESNVWANPDSTGRFKPTFDLFNPVLLTNTLFTAGRTDVHSLAGLNVKLLPTPNIALYAQVAFDDVMNTTKNTGVQLGAKYFDVLGLPGWFLQAEFNRVAKGTYSFAARTDISYTHYNQTLAHPLGNNFKETIALTAYSYRRLRFEYRFGAAAELHTGVAPPKEFDAYTDRKKVVSHHVQAAWIINPRTTMQIAAGYTAREETSATGRSRTDVCFIAFRTALHNRYHDF